MLSEALFRPLTTGKLFSRVDDSTLEGKKGHYLPENDPKRSAVLSEIRDSTSGGKDMESKSFSVETDKFPPRSPFKPFSGSQQYNISSNQERAQNRLAKILKYAFSGRQHGLEW